MTAAQSTASRPALPRDNFLVLLEVPFAYGDGMVRGASRVRPALFASGTTTIRSALLLTMIDFLSGAVSGRAAGPTLDMRLQMLQPPPTAGGIDVVVRPLRVGGRIIVSEGFLTDDRGVVFGRGLTTFMNMPMEQSEHRPPGPMVEASFDDLITTTARDRLTLEFDPGPRHLNGSVGTVQGGVHALLAELCAEHALGNGGRMVASDLDVRFLSALRVGPIVATAEPLPSGDGVARCRVALTDGGDGGRLLCYVALTMTPVP